MTHLLNSNRLLSLPQSIVVGRSTDESVRDLSLSSELGFRDGGHVDDVSSPLSVHLGLSSGLYERRKQKEGDEGSELTSRETRRDFSLEAKEWKDGQEREGMRLIRTEN